MAILVVPMRAPIMRFQMRADAPSAGNRKRDVFGELSPKEQIDFFRELDEACEAAGVPDDALARFQGLRDAMSADLRLVARCLRLVNPYICERECVVCE